MPSSTADHIRIILRRLKKETTMHKPLTDAAQHNIARTTSWARRMGMTMLGSGFFSRVFNHPTDPTKVIKFGPLSDGWLVYAAWCEAQRGTSNPHLPVIHSIRRYEKHGIYMAVLERLATTVCAHKNRLWENCEYKDAEPWMNWRMVEAYMRHGTHGDTYLEWQSFMSQADLTPVFENTLRRLHAFATKHGLGRDLHDENAMLRRRPDGGLDLVITDPFSFSNGDRQAAFEAARHATLAA